MALLDFDDLGTYDYYRTIIDELGLVEEFENVTGESFDDYEIEISEALLIEEVLEQAGDTYALVLNERSPVYRLLRIQE